LGFLASTVWFWGEVEGLDRILYIYGKIFHLGEGHSVWFFYEFLWTKAGGSAFSFVVYDGYADVKPDVECDDEPVIIDRFSVESRDNEELVVNHLLFADATLIFCGAQAEHVRNLRCIFLCFEAASGLRINLGKSELVPIDEVENVGASFKATSIWNRVIEKVEVS